MQKIIIQNFAAIKFAEIEIKKLLVIIGEQSSGKSTIAKLISFFKELRELLFDNITNGESADFDIVTDLIVAIRAKFYDYFGSTNYLLDFEIIYYYDVAQNKFLTLTLNNKNKLHPTFSPEFNLINLARGVFNNYKQSFFDLKNQELGNSMSQIIEQQELLNKLKIPLLQILDNFFDNKHNDALYVVAGRNVTVSYSKIFENFLLSNFEKNISFQNKTQTIDETLMLKFIKKIDSIKSFFKKFGSFQEINSYFTTATNNQKLNTLILQIEKILKGKYSFDDFGEKITGLLGNSYVFLSNASSGQQEAIRILQDIFLSTLNKDKVFRVVEEPEAHLFPVAQKLLIESLLFLANENEYNQLIITTHSPYVLTVLNNSIFGQRIIDKNPASKEAVETIIKQDFLIKSQDVAVYSLATAENGSIASSIINPDTGLINQNYLDTVSEELGQNFNQLLSIHSRSFKRI